MKIYHLKIFIGVIFIIIAIIIIVHMSYIISGILYDLYGTPEVSKCVKQNHEYAGAIKIKEMCELNQSYQICKQEREMK